MSERALRTSEGFADWSLPSSGVRFPRLRVTCATYTSRPVLILVCAARQPCHPWLAFTPSVDDTYPEQGTCRGTAST